MNFEVHDKLTEEERKELDEQLVGIKNTVNKLRKQWGCAAEEEVEEEQEEKEDSQENEPLFFIVEEMPEFPGGMAKMNEYLKYNLIYPTKAWESGIQGRVMISFVIEKDGSISNVKVMRSLEPECDAEAVRVVKAMPKWKPGKQRGEAVRVSYTVPIVFVKK